MKYDEEKAKNLWKALEAQFSVGGAIAIVPDLSVLPIADCLDGGKVVIAWHREYGNVRYGFWRKSEEWWRADVDIQNSGTEEVVHIYDILVTHALVETLVGYLYKIVNEPVKGVEVLQFTVEEKKEKIWN